MNDSQYCARCNNLFFVPLVTHPAKREHGERDAESVYTPRIEYPCKNSSTHYQGCECHEARHSEKLSKSIDAVREFCDLAAERRISEAVKAERARCAEIARSYASYDAAGIEYKILNPPESEGAE